MTQELADTFLETPEAPLWRHVARRCRRWHPESRVSRGASSRIFALLPAGRGACGGVAFGPVGVPAVSVSGSGPNYVWATVPAGATTGPITVATPGGMDAAQANFTVQ